MEDDSIDISNIISNVVRVVEATSGELVIFLFSIYINWVY